MSEPLASRIRPLSLDEFVGQEHLIGSGSSGEGNRPGPLRMAIDKKELFSLILWGPPGCGKTTLARIYAHSVGADFFELSAVDAGKEDVRKILNTSNTYTMKPRILFIDEIHRFNKAQQDYLLPFVERGDITFIGATTENPSFEVIAPLLSRCRVFVLKALSDDNMAEIITRTKIKVPKAARDWLIALAQGDARQMITTIETAQRLYGSISVETLKQAVQSRHLRYDKKGDEHYDTISAFIKSMRASQPDAAIYYLARMIEAGEDPVFIARRMVIFASEDVGLAQPTALVVANAAFRACETIGYPECAINLVHGVAYLSQCKKDRSAYDALQEALADVKKFGNLPIPLSIRNAPTKLMKELGYGKGYQAYPSPELGTGEVPSYLPDTLRKKKYLQ